MSGPHSPSLVTELAAGDPVPTHIMSVPETGEVDTLAIPARQGVAVFEDSLGRAAIIATTADLRGLARRRLGLEEPEAAVSGDSPAVRLTPPRTDHRAVIRRVLAYETGSPLESDVLYLALARLRLPETHRIVQERWEAWYVHVDPDESFPDWTRAPISAGSGLPPAGVVFGPFPAREAAGKFIEAAIDAFDLCREHHLLVQAPKARACPYKELGRCPAPCDGTEPLISYQTRVRRAANLLAEGLAPLCERLGIDMRAAAAATDFELARDFKLQLDRLTRISSPSISHAVDLRRWCAIIVLPAATARRRDSVRVLSLTGGRLEYAGDCSMGDSEHETSERRAIAARALQAGAAAGPLMLTAAAADTLAAVTRWLYSPATRRRGELLTYSVSASAEHLEQKLREAARTVSKRREVTGPEQALERESGSI